MGRMRFGEAIDAAIEERMACDDQIIVFGEDVEVFRPTLLARFGKERVRLTPISESAFVGAAVGAAMGGLRPVVEIQFVDFVGVAMDALMNQMAKIRAFSGGHWNCPVVVRAACGGGYGDAGQHEQSLWGMLAGVPGLQVVVPSTPGDAAGLMRSAIESEDPVIFLEHKLLSDLMLDALGRGGRDTVEFDVPEEGAVGEVKRPIEPVAIGSASVRRKGDDVTIVSLAVGVHRAVKAADGLQTDGISADVVDLRTAHPLDRETICRSVARTGRLVVVDEDYREFGLSGEVAAVVMEADLAPSFRRVAVETTIPYARQLEAAVLPNAARIRAVATELVRG